MIPLLAALLVPRPDLTPAQQAGLIRAFDLAARTGLDPETVLPPYPAEGEQPQFRQDLMGPTTLPGYRAYYYNHATFWVNTRTGRIDGYDDDSRWGAKRGPGGVPLPPKVSDAQAVALARRFFAAAGLGESAVLPREFEGVTRDATDLQSANDRALEVHLVPVANGVRYADQWDGVFEVDRETGQLDNFDGIGETPPPPASLVPEGTPEQARLAAVRFGAARAGEPVAEFPGQTFALRLWLPQVAPEVSRDALVRAYPPAVLAALDAGRALLVYQGTLVGSSWRTSANVTLDARTGEPLQVVPFPDPKSFGGSTPAAPRPDLDVPTVARPWRVATDGKGWDAWTPSVNASLIPVADAAPVGEKLTLTDGKTAFPATYDPTTGLLGISGKAYRPGPALADLLKRRTKG